MGVSVGLVLPLPFSKQLIAPHGSPDQMPSPEKQFAVIFENDLAVEVSALQQDVGIDV